MYSTINKSSINVTTVVTILKKKNFGFFIRIRYFAKNAFTKLIMEKKLKREDCEHKRKYVIDTELTHIESCVDCGLNLKYEKNTDRIKREDE